MPSNQKKNRIGNTIVNIMIVALLIALVISAYAGISKMNNPDDSNTFLGIKPLVIKTNSMEPTIKTGALIIVTKSSFESIKNGDIISFDMGNGALNTHRVVGKADNYIYTKGDNSKTTDPPVTKQSFKYKKLIIMNWTVGLKNFSPTAIMGTLAGIIILLIAIIFLIPFTIKRIRKKRLSKNTDNDDHIEPNELQEKNLVEAAYTIDETNQVTTGSGTMQTPSMGVSQMESSEQTEGLQPVNPQQVIETASSSQSWKEDLLKDVDFDDVDLSNNKINTINLDNF